VKHEPAPYRRVRQQESWLSPLHHPPTPSTVYWISYGDLLGHDDRMQAYYTAGCEWRRIRINGDGTRELGPKLTRTQGLVYLTLLIA
jgi:hypothetical protein